MAPVTVKEAGEHYAKAVNARDIAQADVDAAVKAEDAARAILEEARRVNNAADNMDMTSVDTQSQVMQVSAYNSDSQDARLEVQTQPAQADALPDDSAAQDGAAQDTAEEETQAAVIIFGQEGVPWESTDNYFVCSADTKTYDVYGHTEDAITSHARYVDCGDAETAKAYLDLQKQAGVYARPEVKELYIRGSYYVVEYNKTDWIGLRPDDLEKIYKDSKLQPADG